jgi:hypothetical protein
MQLYTKRITRILGVENRNQDTTIRVIEKEGRTSDIPNLR